MNTGRKNAQQYTTDSSPPLLMGQNLCGRCWVKNATAISPEAMKAAGRVNSPRLISSPSLPTEWPVSYSESPLAQSSKR